MSCQIRFDLKSLGIPFAGPPKETTHPWGAVGEWIKSSTVLFSGTGGRWQLVVYVYCQGDDMLESPRILYVDNVVLEPAL